jgi:D-lactate dehydrogenase (cytochrome)
METPMGLSGAGLNLERNNSGIETAIGILKQRFADKLVQSASVCQQHGNTMSWIPNQAPDAVIFAQSTQEVSQIIKVCAQHHVPVVPFGTGTSLEGHVNAPIGGICVDMAQMDQVLEVHADDLDCVVQAGVTHKQLNEYLRDTGLFFPIDPGTDASIGGMAATRASGTNAVRYGTMKDCVLALTVVMPDGTIIQTGSRAKKSSAGYDLTRLMVGSEGTLGIITEVSLRLSGIPEAISGAVCPFASLQGATNAVIQTIQCGIPIARIELLDELQVQACNAYSKLDLKVAPTLLLEFHGSPAGVEEQCELFGTIAQDNGGGPFHWTANPEERNKLWEARHNAYFSVNALRPGAQPLATDVCVPISRLAECVAQTKREIDRLGLMAPIVGHAGDGNFHVALMVDMTDRQEVDVAEKFIDWLSAMAIEMEGTCTGEHGIGQGKMKYMELEHGPAVQVMAAIKKAIDPQNIMNPGKILIPQ